MTPVHAAVANSRNVTVGAELASFHSMGGRVKMDEGCKCLLFWLDVPEHDRQGVGF